MARLRSIKPEFWSSEQVMECSPIARLMFIGLWNFCDDTGRQRYAPKQIKALIFPSDDISVADIRIMFGELSTNGLIDIYTVEGVEYFQVTGWKHQKIDKPQPSKFPPRGDPFVERSANGIDGARARVEPERNQNQNSSSSRAREFDEDSTNVPRKDGNEFERISQACHNALPAECTWKIKASDDISPIVSAIKDGADLANDVVPAIQARAAQALKNGKDVGSWKYFEDAIRDRHKSRTAANGSSSIASMLKPQQAIAPETQELMAAGYAKSRCEVWLFDAPRPGRKGCPIDPEILRKHGINPETGKRQQ